MTTSDDEPTLDTCGCCDVPEAPPLANPPGQPALAFRVATWATFVQAMKERLARPLGDADTRPLSSLTTRAPDDASMALIDACAVVGDVLSFYQERIANEGYLRTATERRSVLELARAVGYELSPGVAASTYLAFVIDEPFALPTATPQPPTVTPALPAAPAALPSPQIVDIPVGTRVQSVPTQGQLPQTFETIEEIEARVGWNALKPRATQRQTLQIDGGVLQRLDGPDGAPRTIDTLWLDGTSTNLRPGDLLVVEVGAANFIPGDPLTRSAKTGVAVLVVTNVAPDYTALRTALTFKTSSAAPEPPAYQPAVPASDGALDPTAGPVAQTPENVRDEIVMQRWEEGTLAAFFATQRWDAPKVTAQIAKLAAQLPAPASVWALRTRTGVFGHSAPAWSVITQNLSTVFPNSWEVADITQYGFDKKLFPSGPTTYKAVFGADLFLDRVLSTAAPGGWIVLGSGASLAPFRISATTEASLADFGIAGKATGLTLDGASGLTSFALRATSVYLQSEPLAVAAVPIADPVCDPASDKPKKGAQQLELDRMVLGLSVGQTVLVAGILVDAAGAPSNTSAAEVATLREVTHGFGTTQLRFEAPLANLYDRATLVLSGNVARATHGESAPVELLGSGDGSQPNQRFTLKRTPLTWVSAPTASGVQSTLTVRVAGVAWNEEPSLYDLSPTSQSFTLRRDDDGATSVIFGDGKSGARLPTGPNNVVATYRSGLGLDGEVAAGALTLLAQKPLGVRSVTNPLPATGAAAPETLDDARASAPLKVLTLDRIVSLEDFEDFARAFAGIAKAQAVTLWNGKRRILHLTIAGANGGAVDADTDLYRHLAVAIADASDGSHSIAIDSYVPRFFRADVGVYVDPRYEAKTVLAAVQARLEGAYLFAVRGFGQPVTEAEVLALAQGVDGVIGAVSRALYESGGLAAANAVLIAHSAQWSEAQQRVLPAELLRLQPAGVTVTQLELPPR